MAELRIADPATTQEFIRQIARLDVALPITPSEQDLGVLLDADGRDVLTVDSNGERPDDQVEAIAHLICLAVNTCGGLKLEPAEHG